MDRWMHEWMIIVNWNDKKLPVHYKFRFVKKRHKWDLQPGIFHLLSIKCRNETHSVQSEGALSWDVIWFLIGCTLAL